MTTTFPRVPRMILAAAIAGACTAAPAFAEQIASDDDWHVEFTPYAWLQVTAGNIGIGPVTAQVQQSISENLNAAGPVYTGTLLVSKGAWIVGLDAQYYKFDNASVTSWTGPLGNNNTADLSATQWWEIYQPTVGRRVYDKEAKLDIFLGARYTLLKTSASLTVSTGSPLLPDGSRSITKEVTWWDPVIAMAFSAPLSPDWRLVGYLDAGGTSGKDFSHQGYMGASWSINRYLTAKAGYRFLQQRYETGEFKVNWTNFGPYLGLGIGF